MSELNRSASHSYAELRGNNMIRSVGTRAAVKDKGQGHRCQMTGDRYQSIIFGATMVSLR